MSVPIDGGRGRILIVDDQQSNLRLLEHVLRRDGYIAVSSTENPLEVAALHRQSRFDLILLDIQMPRMSGLEVLKGLRSLEEGNDVAVLVLTADPGQMVHALECGATGFLSKPFVLAEVLRYVHLMLEKPREPRIAVKKPRVSALRVRPKLVGKRIAVR